MSRGTPSIVIFPIRVGPESRATTRRVFNNIFLDTAGTMPNAYRLQWGPQGLDNVSGNNCYYNNGNAIPAGDTDLNPATESGHVFANPNLTLSGTPTDWQGWVNYYRPTSSSTAIRDAGNSNAGAVPQPAVLYDIEGNPRPQGNGWDIGPYEYPGTAVVPVADFSASADGATGQQLWTTPPATFDFTDYSSGGPTSWSWNFGDSTTSTAQNPSHTYSSYGQYTVTLTATNSAGTSPTCTKTNYLTVKALNADFSATPTWGAAPLAVSFTDASSNSPTSWSWTFGDGGTSTAHNPSHTYSSVGNYDVSLTAANADGNDTATKAQYINVCTTVLVYPDAWSSWNTSPQGNQYLVSGGLSNLQAEDASYMVMQCDTSKSQPWYSVTYQAHTSYTPNQVAGMTYEYKAHETGNASVPFLMQPVTGAGGYDTLANGAGNVSLTSSDGWWTYGPTAGSSLVSTAGVVGLLACGCGNGLSSYTVSSDVMRFRLYIKSSSGPSAPVADFSGTPTSGVQPLAVSFSDSSTNTPTSWSWNFGDSSTSTAQNPSHTYTSAGNYTVALTAANAGGNDTETKTNCISVTNIVYLQPTGYGYGSGTSLVSGALSDTYTEDAQYLVLACNPSSHAFHSGFSFHTSYTPSQISAMQVQMKLHNSRSDTPTLTFFLLKSDHWNWTVMSSGLWTTSDSWMNYDITNVADNLDSNGDLSFQLCGCPTSGNSNNYQVSWDVARVELTLTGGGTPAPVANFSGTPTSGAYPLAVSFSDSSTNTPTSWSWSFGDGGTSTAQNPSHTYASAGNLHGGPDRHQLGRLQHLHEEQLHHGHGAGAGGELLRHPDLGPQAPGRRLHGLLHQLPHLLVVDVWRRRNQHRAEPEPHLHQRGELHRHSHGHQRGRFVES